MAGWSFYLDGFGVEEPIGWDAIEFTAIRMDSHGIDQPFSTEVTFYDAGALYIKSIFDQYFINQPIAIQIVSDVAVNGVPYEFNGFLNLSIYEETNACDTDSFSVKVGIIDDTFREEFKARTDVEIDLKENTDLNGNEIDPIEFTSLRLHKQEIYITAQGGNLAVAGLTLTYDTDDVVAPWDWVYPDYVQTVPCFWRNSDFKENYGSTFDTKGNNYALDNIIFKNNGTLARDITIQLTVDGRIEFSTVTLTDRTANADFYVILQKDDGTSQTFYLIGSTPVISQDDFNVPFNVNNQFTISVPPDYNLLLLCYWGLGGTMKREDPIGGVFWNGPYYLGVFVDNVCVTLSEQSASQYASFADALKIEDLLNRVIYKLTGSNNKLLSDAFSESGDGCYWNNAITNGVRIRNAPSADDIIYGCLNSEQASSQFALQVTWKKLFENLNNIFCLGWAFEWTGTEWKIRVEPLEYFYQNTISDTFHDVDEVVTSVKPDLLANNIQMGYNDNWKNIAQSGTFAIHTNRNYFVANQAMTENSSKNLDLRSEIIAEGQAIEFSRRLQFFTTDSSSSDRPNDYNLFIIWLNRYALEIENIEDSEYAFPNESGTVTIDAGTVSMSSDRITYSSSPLAALYNIFHTPARIAVRWWKVLGMHTYGLTTPSLRFQVGQYQTSYFSIIADAIEPCQEFLEDESVYENVSISPDVMRVGYKEYLFKPIQIEFSYPQSLCDFLVLSDENEYGKIRLTSGSLDLQGYIQNVTNQPEDSSGGTTKFTLLMAKELAPTGAAFTIGFDDGYQNGN